MLNIIPVMLCVGGLVTGICLVLALDSTFYGYALIGVTLITAISYIIIQNIRQRHQQHQNSIEQISKNVLTDITVVEVRP